MRSLHTASYKPRVGDHFQWVRKEPEPHGFPRPKRRPAPDKEEAYEELRLLVEIRYFAALSIEYQRLNSLRQMNEDFYRASFCEPDLNICVKQKDE